MNKLMTRIYSAMNNGEGPILDQLENDIQIAKEDGKLDTEEYNISPMEDGSVVIHDKVNNEDTKAVDTGEGITLSEIPGNTREDLVIGSPVTWVDSSGNSNTGRLIEINGGLSQVELNNKIITVNTDLLNQMKLTEDRGFSKSRARKYLVDGGGNLMAMGWESSLGKLQKDHPEWKLVSEYDLNAFKNGIEKRFSSFSLENQKLFTKQNRRYVVLDATGKLQHIVDIDNAKGLVEKNKDWTMVKEAAYNQKLQEKLAKFSDTTKNLILKNLKGGLNTAK